MYPLLHAQYYDDTGDGKKANAAWLLIRRTHHLAEAHAIKGNITTQGKNEMVLWTRARSLQPDCVVQILVGIYQLYYL